MNNKPIGVFDSGIGGATVLKEILKILPNEDYIYYSDSKNNPYGDKANEEIFNICDKIVKMFIERECKAIVIACNTASAISAQKLREKYPNEIFIAIEPAYKMVHDNSSDKSTLVMATKGTIECEKFNMLYEKYNNNKTYLMACQGLADIIEQGEENKIKDYLNEHLTEYADKVQNVVLGCTHYPLIKEQIKNVLGDVEFFDGAPYAAKHLKDVLEKAKLTNNSNIKGNIEFIDSSNSEFKKQRFFTYLMK